MKRDNEKTVEAKRYGFSVGRFASSAIGTVLATAALIFLFENSGCL